MPKRATRRKRRPEPTPADAAKDAGLHYVCVHDPKVRAKGIRRLGAGKGFRYVDADGHAVRDERTLDRIRKLAIPPAYKDVWIAADAKAHIQAIGTDDAGRLQYRYHPDWHAARGETKFHRTLAFAKALPKIREQVAHDLAKRGMPREKVLATVVALLERTMIRVGNEEYAKAHEHYGLTTLRAEHSEVEGQKVHFSFTGKSGVEHDVLLKNKRLARIVRELQDLPGQELFHYVDEAGETHKIGSSDVNAYIQEISGERFTAKDFRTWAGTVLAAEALGEIGGEKRCATKKEIVTAVKKVASELRNTPAVARSGYIHPGILKAATEGTLPAIKSQEAKPDETGLHPDERTVLRLLSKNGTGPSP